MEIYNVIIIGSGPAGYTAAIYTSRARLNPLMICGYMQGGQLTLTSEVENFPGFPDGILGPKLMENMKRQAEKFGTKLIFEDVSSVDFNVRPFKVSSDTSDYYGKSIIIATGSSAKMLNVEGEKEYLGRGVSTCATCDAAFFKDKIVAVVGGGDSALEEALFLTKFAKLIYLIHRRDQLRGSKILQDRAFKSEKIKFIWNSIVLKIMGDKKVSAIEIRDIKEEKTSILAVDGIFIAVGHKPNTEIFKDFIKLDSHGYIITDEACHTNIEGVFAAGDVRDHKYRQAITAAGYGCIAALEVEKYLSNQQ